MQFVSPRASANGVAALLTSLAESRKRTIKMAVAAVIFLAVVIYSWLSYLNSPDRVIRLAIGALDAHDAKSLLALSSEREQRLLHLTVGDVQTCLLSSYWSGRARHPAIRNLGSSNPWEDIRTYTLSVSAISPNVTPGKFAVDVYQYKGGRWYLDLSELLYVLTKAASEKQGKDASEFWDSVARDAGITAVASAANGTRYTDGSHSPTIRLTHD